MEVAEKLQELFKASGYTSWNDLRDDVLMRLGKEYTPSAETIKQMHTPGGKASKTPDPVVIGVLCWIYRQPVEAVSPDAARILRTVRMNKAIDLRGLGSSCDHAYGSDEPRLPFPDDQFVVIDLTDRAMARIDEKDSLDLYARAV